MDIAGGTTTRRPHPRLSSGQLADALQAYTHPAVLVVDDVGYLTYGTDAETCSFTS
jgi:hypothetical protein